MAHRRRDRMSLVIGAIVNKNMFDGVGYDCSFTNNLMASAKG